MLDKENTNLDCKKCRDTYQLSLQKDKEVAKLKDELSYLKHLLADKTLELKKKQEELDVAKLKSP
jgi:hypothetical protein